MIFISAKKGAQPQLVSDVTNMKMGDGFLAYTKEDAIYAYVFETGKIIGSIQRFPRVCWPVSAGRSVCWYDVTSYDDVDVVKIRRYGMVVRGSRRGYMAKAKSLYRCSECGYETVKWLGKCPSCGEWNTLEEVAREMAPTYGGESKALQCR